MLLKKLRLFNYKNHESAEFDFREGLNCIVGKNGSGKTNVLDAIYFICLTKSHFSTQELDCISHGADMSTVKAEFSSQSQVESIRFFLQKGKKKIMSMNDSNYDRLSEHIGKIPVILIEPEDTDYIRMGSEMRRKLFDGMIAQTSKSYLEDLMNYNRNLKQRNQFLKDSQEKSNIDYSLLDVFDNRLLHFGRSIYESRRKFTGQFQEGMEDVYAKLSGKAEKVGIQYESNYADTEEPFEERFKKMRSQDLFAGRTLIGVHRDDYLFFLESPDRLVRHFASQGQQKTFIMSVKLNQINYFQRLLGQKPLLLLDDIFDKLDSNRISNLLSLISSEDLQAVMTDARKERTLALVKDSKTEVHIIDIQNHE